MRYYRIEISPAPALSPATGDVETVVVSPPDVFTSLSGQRTNPNALNVELDVPVSVYATPDGQALIRIWGVSINQINQASNFNNRQCSVYGGMQKGLPLANPKQAGLLVQGNIFQAFGNWIDTEQSLDLILTPNTGSPISEANVILNWKKGTPLAMAIKNALAVAFPSFTSKISISPNLVLTGDEVGFFQSLEQFAAYVKRVSQTIIGGNYPGVDIAVQENVFIVDDATTQTSPKLLVFQDFIGQPTWIDAVTVQFKMVMRADLALFDYIKFPPVVVTQSAQAASPLVNAKLTFQGVFQIKSIRHVGNFRQEDPASWVTVFEAFATKPVAA